LDTLVGKRIEDIRLSDVERVILQEEAVQSVDVFLNSKEELIAQVEMKKVILRIKPNDAEGYYIDEHGKLMRWIPQFTPKVLTVFGAGDAYPRYERDTLSGWEYNQKLIDDLYTLFQALEKDAFCKAQIGSIYINGKGELEFNPLIGEHRIIFGNVEDVPEKLKKLKVFYKEIVRQAGWSKYQTVNLKFKNQIVCK
jgi:cell division protein FtsQ